MCRFMHCFLSSVLPPPITLLNTDWIVCISPPSARPATERGAAPGPQAARSQVRNIVQLCGGGGAGSHFHNYCFKGILN